MKTIFSAQNHSSINNKSLIVKREHFTSALDATVWALTTDMPIGGHVVIIERNDDIDNPSIKRIY